MTVKIFAGSWARQFIRQETATLNLNEGSTVEDALAELSVPPDEIGLTVIDNKAVARETGLRDGDIIKIFPVIAGG